MASLLNFFQPKIVSSREQLSSRHSVVLASGEPAPSGPTNPQALPDSERDDVASPFTSGEVRQAQQLAMRLRRQHGAVGAKSNCRRMLEQSRDPYEARFLQLVLRSIGGAG